MAGGGEGGGSLSRVFDLEQPRTPGMPIHPSHQPGYSYFLHRHHEEEYRPRETGGRTSASGLVVAVEHSGTHIDALCHQAEDLCMHGGVPVGEETQGSRGFERLGVEEIPSIAAPGALLDVAALHGVEELEPGYAVSVGDLEACCERQGVSVRAGGVALVRTGNARRWEAPERYLAGPGVSTEGSEWLAERGVIAVGADNMAWDVIGYRDPGYGCQLAGHLILLVRHGIYIVENLALEELAAAGEHRFTFVCAPLKLVGATGSPVRPIALVPGA